MPNNTKCLTNCLTNCLTYNITYNDIYSSEGLFRIQNNSLFQLIPKDISVINIKYKDTEFLIDKSYYIFNKNIYCIPYDHIIYNIEKTEYKLDKKSKISLIVEKCDNIIKDIYFITKEEIFHDYLKKTILYIYFIPYRVCGLFGFFGQSHMVSNQITICFHPPNCISI